MGRVSAGWDGREGHVRTRDGLSMEVEACKRELRSRLNYLERGDGKLLKIWEQRGVVKFIHGPGYSSPQ